MRILWICFSFLAGAVCAYAAAIVCYIVYFELSGTTDREGAMGMGVAFVIGPVVALIGGVTAAILAGRRPRG